MYAVWPLAVIAIGVFSYRWHETFDTYYTSQRRLLTATAMRDLTGVESPRVRAYCYLYYPLLGSRRELPVTRPLHFADQREVLEDLLLHRPEMMAVRWEDRYGRGSYLVVTEFIQTYPAAFLQRAEPDPHVFVTVNYDRLPSPEDL